MIWKHCSYSQQACLQPETYQCMSLSSTEWPPRLASKSHYETLSVSPMASCDAKLATLPFTLKAERTLMKLKVIALFVGPKTHVESAQECRQKWPLTSYHKKVSLLCSPTVDSIQVKYINLLVQTSRRSALLSSSVRVAPIVQCDRPCCRRLLEWRLSYSVIDTTVIVC